jgi:hypothetical protein
VVVSDGRGGTVEAHSSTRGVVRDKLQGRRWDFIPKVIVDRVTSVYSGLELHTFAHFVGRAFHYQVSRLNRPCDSD